MAKIRFLKENEPSQKKDYIPASTKYKEINKLHIKHKKKYKIILIISGIVNFILLGFNLCR